ncbi:Translin [Pyronema omphalodes]|nr:Translin [Pyronema omphalodes]
MADQVYSAIDQNIFSTVTEQIDQDLEIRESIREVLKNLDKQLKQISATLSRVHSVPPSEVPNLITKTQPIFEAAKNDLHELIQKSKPYPYYKYNMMWQREMQNLVFLILLETWLSRVYLPTETSVNALATIEEIGARLSIPVNLKTEDAFHLNIEEYLHAVISLVEELTRLMTNAVTQRDFKRPMLISTFVKDIHSAFQVLNLKNDALRRRGDGLKYHVKRAEDITYDLIVRNLVDTSAEDKKGEEKKAEEKADVKAEDKMQE